MTQPNQQPAWAALKEHRAATASETLSSLLTADSSRPKRYTASAAGIHLDFSRHLINDQTMSMFEQLLEQQDMKGWQAKMFGGEAINTSEGRAVLHVALRGSYKGTDTGIPAEVAETQQKFFAFAQAVRNGTIKSHSGEAFTDVINLGIGGSDLGPRLICHALADKVASPRVHFVANLDPTEMHNVLMGLNPATTLFILSSKSYSTMETQANAEAAVAWLTTHFKNSDIAAIKAAHFCAVSNNIKAISSWGIALERCFTLPEWVGGRFSLWSAVGLSIAIAIGEAKFREMLQGAHEMDEHFLNAPLNKNLPALLAILGVWYTNFHGAQTHGVISYSERLRYLPDYLQQLEMESNGKCVDKEGKPVTYATSPALFGGLGTTTQHSFFQMLHQGTQLVPLDIISVSAQDNIVAHEGDSRAADLLLFAQAQSDALAYGVDALPVSLREQWQAKPSYSHFPASRPNSRIHLDALTPHTLGALIAMYEHKTFLQGVIWHINSFDQWGVELGKVMFGSMK
ncbi:glucose-6-phosphate isomerase [Hydromonas duriensis]|uniref:Glucose-6-phosphate isomerase n=1 Tax=Hydromonas duriensis TaxID=1527608 RepID=A0A4R6Y7H5_9BURK|nr:glucose-6-phosphate isomerase [Hydromonas duriensis]TDR31284.1 glucose-6-phosphate isomerase [Hydromonas duriensis]